MFDRETKEELLEEIHQAVDSVIIEFRTNYTNPAHISSPHLVGEIVESIAGKMPEVHIGEWDEKAQLAMKCLITETVGICIDDYRRVYPSHAAVSSPHLPEAIATAVMRVVDDTIYAIEKEARDMEEAKRKAAQAELQARKKKAVTTTSSKKK
jgi:hypothetical protein